MNLLNFVLSGLQKLEKRAKSIFSFVGLRTYQQPLVHFTHFIRPIKGKAITMQAWTGQEWYRNLKLPNFKTINT